MFDNVKNELIYKNIVELDEKIKKHLPYIFNNPYKTSLPKSSDLLELYRENQYYYKKLNELKAKCKENNLHIYLITLSVPHNHQHRLDTLTNILDQSVKEFQKKNFHIFEDIIDLQFKISKFEVDLTDKFGWNPHNHSILVAKKDIDQETLSKYESELQQRYYQILIKNKAINSQINYWLKDEYEDKVGVRHKGHILNIQKDFNYLPYIADNTKQLKKHISKLNNKSYSPYQLPLIYSDDINYDNLFVQYVELMKIRMKKRQRSKFSLNFDFSSQYFLGVDFKYEKIKTIKKTFKDFTFKKPNLDTEIQKYKEVNAEILSYDYKIMRNYLQPSSIFLADKLMKHYHLDQLYFQNTDMSKKFKLWVNFISGINFYAYVGYIHENIDPDCLKKSEDVVINFRNYDSFNDRVPELIKDLAFEYRDFYQNLRGYPEYKKLAEEKAREPLPFEHRPEWIKTKLDELMYDYDNYDNIDDFLILKPARLIEKFKSQKVSFDYVID